MAVYYFRNNTANWGVAANWSLTDGGGATGAIPTAADDAIFTNLSGPCTVDTTSRVCKTLTFTTYTNTITMTNNITVSGSVTLGASMGVAGTGLLVPNATGTLTSNGKVWSSGLSLRGISTFTLADDWVVTGNLLIGASTETITVNGAFTLSTAGNFTVGTSTSVSGTATIVLNGTGTVSTTGSLRNNLTVNTAGTITFSGTIIYNTGTLTYTAGTVVTTGSTLSIGASTTLSTGTLAWNNISIANNGANIVITLGANLKVASTFTLNPTLSVAFTLGGFSMDLSTATFSVVLGAPFTNITMPFTYAGTLTCANFTTNIIQSNKLTLNSTTLNVTGNLTLTMTAGSFISGTTNINLTGTGTFSMPTSGSLSNNLTFNTAGTVTVSGTIVYNTGTLTYTAGTIIVTGSTLVLATTVTLNVGAITWNNINSGTGTLTLLSDLVFIGTYSAGNAGTLTLAGVGIINSPNGTVQLTSSGGNYNFTTTATHNVLNYQVNATGFAINSSGTWNVYGNVIRNGVGTGRTGTGIINFVGTGSVLFNGGSTGALVGTWNINTTGTITFGSTSFPDVYIEQGTLNYVSGEVITSSCNLRVGYTNSGTSTFNTGPVVWTNFFVIGFAGGSHILQLNSDFNVVNFTAASGTLLTINGSFPLNVSRNLSVLFQTSGTATIAFTGTGTWSATSVVQNNFTINTSGTLTLSGSITYNTGTFRYILGKVITTNSTLALTGGCTLINCHKIPFNIVTITAGVTITMNQFFSGIPTKRTTIQSSTTANYTIAFQDGFEKIAKFINLNNATFTRPNQLLILTRGPMKTTNSGGVRYLNQSPNGFAKYSPSVNDPMTYPAAGLVSDPAIT